MRVSLRPSVVCVTLCGLYLGCNGNGNGNGDNNTDDSFCNYDSTRPIDACASAVYIEDVSACVAVATDYQPRAGVSGANGWPTCISDDNTYHLVGDTIPAAVSRSIAFERMSERLWANHCRPSKDDFLVARDDYSVEGGLASRVGRRQDISYPEVASDDKFACQQEGIPSTYPDRCFGPAVLKPMIDEAFQKGIAQDKPRVQAARIEAALVWFFYLSMTSEVWTCSCNDKSDCDSAAAYYTQLSARDSPTGLAKYVQRLGPETHHRIYDALLAVRCWRDADQAEVAADTQRYQAALSQLEKAGRRGIALILRERIGKIGCTTGEEQEANIEFVREIGGFINHVAGLANVEDASSLKAYSDAPSTTAESIAAAQGAIDSIFACP